MEEQKDNRRLYIIGGIVLLLLLIIFLIWWFFFRVTEVPEVDLTPQPTPGGEVVLPSPDPVDEQPVEVVQPTDSPATVVARNFTERFGSYSNETNFQNIKDLYPLMTTSFRNSLNLDDTTLGEEYVGVDTKVLNVKLDESGSSLIAEVSTQRRERGADLTESVVYQTLVLELIPSGDTWLINSANWE